jgi:hypothetical protein
MRCSGQVQSAVRCYPVERISNVASHAQKLHAAIDSMPVLVMVRLNSHCGVISMFNSHRRFPEHDRSRVE